jgi:hypothetical protein
MTPWLAAIGQPTPRLIVIPAALAVLLTWPGCGPRYSPEEHGTLHQTIPQFEGMEKPYPLPGIDDPAPVQPKAANGGSK